MISTAQQRRCLRAFEALLVKLVAQVISDNTQQSFLVLDQLGRGMQHWEGYTPKDQLASLRPMALLSYACSRIFGSRAQMSAPCH